MFNAEDPASSIISVAEIASYASTLKAEEKFELIVEDSQYETTQTDIVDYIYAN